MCKSKKFMAIALVATMVFGSCITAYADEPVSSGTQNGAGTSEGHLKKEVLNFVLPVVPAQSTPFNYKMDPERLIRETEGAKYAGADFPAAAGDTGVYFLTATNTYANSSNVLQAINKSSCDVTLTVKVKTTASEGGKDIALAESSAVATEGTPNLYLGLKVGNDTTVVSGTEKTVTKTIAGVPGNFETAVVDNAYTYREKANATSWKAINISMEGKVSNLAIASDTTAPTVNVTWSYAKAADSAEVATDVVDYSTTPASAAPSIAVTSYDMVADTPVTVSYSLGIGDAAAEGIESVIWTEAYPTNNLYQNTTYVTKDDDAKTFTLTATSINNMIARAGDSQVIKVTFKDGTAVDLTFNDPE